MACKLFSRTYCGRPLSWYVLQDEFDPEKAPDIVFQDDFSPLTAVNGDADLQQQLLQQLRGWSSTSSVEELIGVLLALYAQHNKARIAAAVTDERILFELAMLDELGCTEVLSTGGDGSGPQQARFTLPLPVDLQPAQLLLSSIHKVDQQPPGHSTSLEHKQQQQQHQQQQHQQQGQQFMLTVSFPVSDGGSSSHIPVLQLKSPAWFTAQLPTLTLPPWDPHTSLLEYVPHLAERVTKHLADQCPKALQRFMLFEGLSDLLGPPLEVNMDLLQSNSSSNSSSMLAAAAASAGSRGHNAIAAGSAAGVWQVLFDGQPLLLFVELPRIYPAEAPVLCLQNLRRTGSDSIIALQNLPWSPRWPVEEQVARLFNFLKLQAAKACVDEQGTAAGGPGAVIGGAGMSPAAAAAGVGLPGASSAPAAPGFYV